jgi:hypothetical protein
MEYFESIEGDNWQRVGNHPVRGKFSLVQQLFLCPLHDTVHIEQMTRIFAEKIL